jgi:hypothetical protein
LTVPARLPFGVKRPVASMVPSSRLESDQVAPSAGLPPKVSVQANWMVCPVSGTSSLRTGSMGVISSGLSMPPSKRPPPAPSPPPLPVLEEDGPVGSKGVGSSLAEQAKASSGAATAASTARSLGKRDCSTRFG